VPSAATPSAPTSRCSPIPKPSRNTTSHRCSPSGRCSSWSSRSAVAVTNRRETAEREVPVAACSTRERRVPARPGRRGSTARPASWRPPRRLAGPSTRRSHMTPGTARTRRRRRCGPWGGGPGPAGHRGSLCRPGRRGAWRPWPGCACPWAGEAVTSVSISSAMTSRPTATEAASRPSGRCSANRARRPSRRPASRSASPSVAVPTSHSWSGSVVSSAGTGVCESCIRGPPPRTWRSSERGMFTLRGRTPPQIPRTPGQPPGAALRPLPRAPGGGPAAGRTGHRHLPLPAVGPRPADQPDPGLRAAHRAPRRCLRRAGPRPGNCPAGSASGRRAGR
jgi:hypothetical protein